MAEFNALLARVEALENGSGASTSTFSIWFEGDEFTYTFENGMTWSEFIASDYNKEIECMNCGTFTRAFAADGNQVFFRQAPKDVLLATNGRMCCAMILRMARIMFG